MTPEQITALLASALLKNQDQGPNWVEIASLATSVASFFVTSFLTWLLVHNDNARSLREVEAKETEKKHARRMAFNDAETVFKSTHSDDSDIKAAINLRKHHPDNHYAILRGYESVKTSAHGLLLRLAEKDPNGYWPTPKEWADWKAESH